LGHGVDCNVMNLCSLLVTDKQFVNLLISGAVTVGKIQWLEMKVEV